MFFGSVEFNCGTKYWTWLLNQVVSDLESLVVIVTNQCKCKSFGQNMHSGMDLVVIKKKSRGENLQIPTNCYPNNWFKIKHQSQRNIKVH